jgi:hypothetical protein
MNLRGQWFRSAVKLEGDMIVPIPPFEAYNPFDRYYPASEVRQGDKSLYLEFFAVNIDNRVEVVRFCERFGVLGSSLPLLADDLAKMEYNFKEATKGALEIVQSSVWEKLLQKWENLDARDFQPEQLCQSMKISDFQTLQSAFGDELHLPADPSTTTAEKEAMAKYINSRVRASRADSCMKWDVQNGQFETVFYSLDLAGVFFQMVKLDLLAKGRILCCPRCRNLFVTGSDRVRFCSFPCYNVYKVQEHLRKKKALAAQKRGEKAATPKPRNT